MFVCTTLYVGRLYVCSQFIDNKQIKKVHIKGAEATGLINSMQNIFSPLTIVSSLDAEEPIELKPVSSVASPLGANIVLLSIISRVLILVIILISWCDLKNYNPKYFLIFCARFK